MSQNEDYEKLDYFFQNGQCPNCYSSPYSCPCYRPVAPVLTMPPDIFPPQPSHSPPPPYDQHLYSHEAPQYHGPPSAPPPLGKYGSHTSWVDASTNGNVPPNAVQGGNDGDGHVIYVGRAYHEGDWIPAKVIPSKNAAYVPWGGEEHLKHTFQFLCGGKLFHWVSCSQGSVSYSAVPAGKTRNGETLYVGRVRHNGALIVGKVQPSHRTCYIPYNGREMAFPDYAVLVDYSF